MYFHSFKQTTMDKYLLEILKAVNTIIIPGLGALSITNKETGEIMFMPYLKHDDGQLVAHIVEKEGMDENEAKNLIAKYVREILAELDKGEEYTMYKFGAFIKNGDDVDFKNWNEIKSSEENIYIPPTSTKEEVQETPRIDETTTAEAIEKPAKKVTEEKTEKIEDKVVKPIVVPIPEKKPVVSKEIPIDKKEELDSNKEKLNRLKKEAQKESKKKKKGAGFWIGILLLILLLGGGTYFGLNYDTLKDKIPFLTQEEKTYDIDEIIEETKKELTEIEEEKYEESVEQVEENAENSLNNEESLSENEMVMTENEESTESKPKEEPETVVTEKEVTLTPPSTSSSGQYKIIIGAFSSLENAERQVSQLSAEGYSASIKSGTTLHKVSIQSFATSSDAKAALKQIKEKYPHAWIDKW